MRDCRRLWLFVKVYTCKNAQCRVEYAALAQMAEHPPCKRKVAGSIPARGSARTTQNGDTMNRVAAILVAMTAALTFATASPAEAWTRPVRAVQATSVTTVLQPSTPVGTWRLTMPLPSLPGFHPNPICPRALCVPSIGKVPTGYAS